MSLHIATITGPRETVEYLRDEPNACLVFFHDDYYCKVDRAAGVVRAVPGRGGKRRIDHMPPLRFAEFDDEWVMGSLVRFGRNTAYGPYFACHDSWDLAIVLDRAEGPFWDGRLRWSRLHWHDPGGWESMGEPTPINKWFFDNLPTPPTEWLETPPSAPVRVIMHDELCEKLPELRASVDAMLARWRMLVDIARVEDPIFYAGMLTCDTRPWPTAIEAGMGLFERAAANGHCVATCWSY